MEEQSFPIFFNEWLKLRRRALDLTQVELAKRAGCSVGTLRKIEAGDRRPSKQLAELLAQALEITEEEQQTFVRIARGELSVKRLRELDRISLPIISEGVVARKDQLDTSMVEGVHLTSSPNRIPLQTTPLFGREIELTALGKQFADPQCRLLTLTGIGGIGKTRLAIEFATRNQSAFPGGVFYIPLTPVNSPEKIIPLMADVLGFGFSGPGNPREQLLNFISSIVTLDALFVFDNLEHLLVPSTSHDENIGVVELISEILQRSPSVNILGTSREYLNLHGEWTFELHGLSVPPTEYIDDLETYDAIALFLSSARRVNVEFKLTPGDKQSLVRICQLVEGIPLAIELAATWVNVLTCEEIVKEIELSMDFLATSMRDIPARHRSIRATFDHSWKLLSEEERKVLCQLSVFRGGFDRQAADQVAEATLPVLASLTNKSLVRHNGSGRYDLHEVTRQYVATYLTQQPRAAGTYARHGEYYLSMLKEHESLLKNASQQDAMRQLTVEIDNIFAAWAWAIEHNKFVLLGQAGRAFGWYFEIAGLYPQGIEYFGLLEQALKSSPQSSQLTKVLGLAYIHQALLFFRKGEFKQAQHLYEESILILRPTGEQVLLADALVFVGTILYLLGEYGQARLYLEEGLDLARRNNEQWFEAWGIFNLGHIESMIGHYEQGYEQMLVGIGMWRTLGDPQSIALGLNFLVPTLNILGHFEEAKSLMHESIALCEQSKNRWGMGTAYRFLGLTCIKDGEIAEGKAHLLKSLEIFGDFSVGWDIARTLTYLGDAALMEDKLLEARENYETALRTALDSKGIPIALDAISGISKLQARAGNLECALVLCFFILNHPSSESETRDSAEQLRDSLIPKLTPSQVQEARVMAKEKSFELIISQALETQ